MEVTFLANFYMILIVCFGGAVIFVQTLFIGYTDTVVARFNQSLAVAGPYITLDQRAIYLAYQTAIAEAVPPLYQSTPQFL